MVVYSSDHKGLGVVHKIAPPQWRIQDGAFGANAPPPPLQEIAYNIEIL